MRDFVQPGDDRGEVKLVSLETDLRDIKPSGTWQDYSGPYGQTASPGTSGIQSPRPGTIPGGKATTGRPAVRSGFAHRSDRSAKGLIITTKVCGLVLVGLACVNLVLFELAVIVTVVSQSKAKANESRIVSIDEYARNSPNRISSESFAFILGMGIFAMPYCGTMVYGAGQMYFLQRWGWALASAIMAVIPCSIFTPIFSIPIGILSIVLLALPAVRQEFC